MLTELPPNKLTRVIGGKLEEFARIQPNKVAIYYEDRTITYEQFTLHVADYQARLLEKVNSDKKQRVALLIGNEPLFLEVYFAVIMLGWTAIPFDSKWTQTEASEIKKLSNPTLIVTCEAFKEVVTYDFKESVYIDKVPKKIGANRIPQVIRSNEPFYLGFTSGSTGIPKGFIRNQCSWIKSFTVGEAVFQYHGDSIIMAPGPLAHSLSLFGATHALHIGASFSLMPNFSAKESFKKIESGIVTVMYGVPTMFHSLAKLAEKSLRPITFLSSGAKLHQGIKEGLRRVFPNAIIYEYFGASELSYVTYASDSFSKANSDSVGIPFPSVSVAIRDERGRRLPSNQIGDIYIESDFLFSGYVKNEKATKETLTNNGAFIGDVGYLNEAGALTVVGRKHNMIITGGQNVYPEEIEKIIKLSNAVKDVVIIGVEHTHWGEVIYAFMEWKENHEQNIHELRQLCKEHLSVYKRPRKYISVAQFPYTKTGKIARHEIQTNIKRWLP